jgi:Secretion system C-terminal sorting domain
MKKLLLLVTFLTAAAVVGFSQVNLNWEKLPAIGVKGTYIAYQSKKGILFSADQSNNDIRYSIDNGKSWTETIHNIDIGRIQYKEDNQGNIFLTNSSEIYKFDLSSSSFNLFFDTAAFTYDYIVGETKIWIFAFFYIASIDKENGKLISKMSITPNYLQNNYAFITKDDGFTMLAHSYDLSKGVMININGAGTKFQKKIFDYTFQDELIYFKNNWYSISATNGFVKFDSLGQNPKNFKTPLFFNPQIVINSGQLYIIEAVQNKGFIYEWNTDTENLTKITTFNSINYENKYFFNNDKQLIMCNIPSLVNKYSEDLGKTWNVYNKIETTTYVWDINISKDEDVYIRFYYPSDSIMYFTNATKQWDTIMLEDYITIKNFISDPILVPNGNVIIEEIGVGKSNYQISNDKCKTWIKLSLPTINENMQSITDLGIIHIPSKNGITYTKDGYKWTEIPLTFDATMFNYSHLTDENIFLIRDFDKNSYTYDIKTKNRTKIKTPKPIFGYPGRFCLLSNDKIAMITDTLNADELILYDGKGKFMQSIILPDLLQERIFQIKSFNDMIFARTIDEKLFVTIDFGKNWFSIKLPFDSSNMRYEISPNGKLYVGSKENIYYTNINNITETKNLLETPLALEVFPNPTTDKATIVLSENIAQNAHLKLYNTEGKILQQLAIQQNTTILNLQNLPNGLYFIAVSNGNKTGIIKVVKE